MKLAVFASGNGGNFQALVNQSKVGQLKVEIAVLVCDRPQAKVIERAEAEGVSVVVLQPKAFSSKAEYEQALLFELDQRGVDFVVLAGYMRIVGKTLLASYEGRMINLHPSLLPAFPGKEAIADAFAYGVKLTGVTVHYVDSGMDTGPIIAQQAVPIEQDDTLDSLAERIHLVEHALLPQVINRIAVGHIRLNGRKVIFTR